MSTSEDRTCGASGTAEQQGAGLLGGDVREGYAEIGDQRLHYVEADASHWVHHDEAERVTQLLTDFFAPALPAKNR